MRVETTESGTLMFSAAAMEARRVDVDASSRGLKRNLEHREARGSIILWYHVSQELQKVKCG